jgi:ABC-type molybdate transport system ATPase subunit
METQQVVNALFGVVGAGVAWWVNTIWGMVRSQQEQITQLNVKLVESYVPRVELEKTFSRIFDTLEKINEQLTHVRNNQAHTKAMQEVLARMQEGRE